MEVKILLYVLGAIILFIHVMIKDKEEIYSSFSTLRLKIRAFVVCILLWPVILILSIILEIIRYITLRKTEKDKSESGE